MTITKLKQYKNGNANITLLSNGTRSISYPSSGLKLRAPLNIDIRVSTKCSFGLNKNTGKAVCDFCHESAVQDGFDCNYDELKYSLKGILSGTELAIGCNEMTQSLVDFLVWCKLQGYICNLTLNQGHVKRDKELIKYVIKNHLAYGIGLSYRSEFSFDVPSFILDNPNTVLHVIAGIDDVEDIKSLRDKGVRKILVLGEKSFGFNEGKVNTESKSHYSWRQQLRYLFDIFDVVSFDNLAIEQLKPQRFLKKNKWDDIYQGEHSFYIDAVAQRYKPSSRSFKSAPFSKTNAIEYFEGLND